MQGARASPWHREGGSGTPRWKQEVAEAASALATELLRCEGRKKTRGREEVGWASGIEAAPKRRPEVQGWG